MAPGCDSWAFFRAFDLRRENGLSIRKMEKEKKENIKTG